MKLIEENKPLGSVVKSFPVKAGEAAP